MKILTSQLLFTCFLFALYFSIRLYRKWDLDYLENRLFSGLCFSSAIWSLGFWGVNIQTDAHKAYLCRSFGMLGVFAFLIIGLHLILYLSILPSKWKCVITGLSLTGIILYFFLLPEDRVTYQMSSIGMTYSFNSGIWNNIYVIYSIVLAFCMAAAVIYTLRNTKFMYVRLLMKKLLLAEILIVSGMCLDTIFPLIGLAVFPGSTIGQFVGLVAMYDAVSFINRSRINISNMSKYVYSSLSLPVLVYDDNLKLKILNDAAFSFLEVIHEKESLPISVFFKVQEKEVFCFEGNRKDLDTVCVHNQTDCNLSINKIINDYGDLLGYIIIVTDLSERIHAFKKMEDATREATYANQAKTTFLANMSHEIRTPMNAIIGFSELLMKMDINPEARSYVEDIRIASHNLLAIINDILDITKIESGKMEIIPEDYYLANLLDDVTLIISQQAQKKGLNFQMKIDPNLPCKLRGDKIRIRGVLINILNNAVKYTKEGFVSFEVSIVKRTDRKIKLAFKISDSGIGIRQEDLENIFQTFSRMDQKLHTDVEGSGLGLSIANGYVSLMGGEIQVSSEYGKGSTFTIIIDQEIVNATVMEHNFSISRRSMEETTYEQIKIENVDVLIVDDNRINLRVAHGIFSSYGLNVDTASGGQEAIEMCSKKHYALIFMDQMMPEVDGVMAMKEIRQLDDYYAPGGEGKIIVLTADAIRGVREQLLKQGFDAYLGKPMNIKRLEDLLMQYLPAEKITVISSNAIEEQGEKNIVAKETGELSYLQDTLPMVYVQKGIDFCGRTIKGYLEILKITYTYGAKNLEELKTFLEKEDYENYTIKIHSMKSTSMNIGAEMISEMARAQEMAGKEKRYTYINEHYQEFCEKYKELLESIHQVLVHFDLLPGSRQEDRPVLEESIFQATLHNIQNKVEEFEFAQVFEILEQLENYQVDDKQAELIKQIKVLMDDFNVDEINALLDSYESSL